MAIGAGIAAQFGYKTESSVNTLVVVDKFLELKSEKVANDGGKRYVSNGIRAGRLVAHRAARGVPMIGGPITFELPNVTVAPLLKHCFGTVVTTGAGPYTHTFTPGPLTGVSFTAQVGRPSIDGTVNPFTWGGCKVIDWTLAATVDDYVQFTPTIHAMSETTATALASASYASGYAPFTFTQASLTIASAAVAVNAFTLKGVNSQKTDRRGPGSTTIREPLTNAQRDFSGTIDADFESLTNYTRFTAATQAALVLTFSNGTDSLVITTNVEFTGESPAVSDRGILAHPQPFSCISGTSDAASITAVLINSDSSAV